MFVDNNNGKHVHRILDPLLQHYLHILELIGKQFDLLVFLNRLQYYNNSLDIETIFANILQLFLQEHQYLCKEGKIYSPYFPLKG